MAYCVCCASLAQFPCCQATLWLKMATLRGLASPSCSPVIELEEDWLDLAASIGEAFSTAEVQQAEEKKANRRPATKRNIS